MTQILVEGYDPTTDPGSISQSELLQMVRAAQFVDGVGGVIDGPTAPDVIADPKMEFFIWAKTESGIRNGEFYYWDGTAWALLFTLDGANIIDGTVPLSKLSASGYSPGYVLVVNDTGDEIVAVDFATLSSQINFSIGSITPGANGQFVVTRSGVTTWDVLRDADIASLNIPFARLTGGTSWQLLYKNGSNVVTWGTFEPNLMSDGVLPPAKISPTGGDEGDVLKIVSGGVQFWPESGNEVEVYAQNNTYAATMDISFTKPADKTWTKIRLRAIVIAQDGTSLNTISAAFTWRTAPETGNALATGASVGCSNAGQVFGQDDSNVCPLTAVWVYEGVIDPDLNDVDTITVRVTYTIVNFSVLIGSFTGVAVYE